MKNFFWRAKEFIKSKIHNSIDKEMLDQQQKWMQSSNILFTQIKSGTTFLTNFFAANNYLTFDFEDEFDLTQPEKYGAFNITRSNYKKVKEIITIFKEKYDNNIPLLFVTHHREHLPKILNAETNIIMTTRERVDWLDSALDFKFVKREKKITRKMAIDLLLKRYKNTDFDQKILNKDHNKSIILRYEKLFNDQELIRVFQFLKININVNKIKKIKKMVSIDQIKNAEKKLGYPLIAGKDFKGKSFINEKKKK